MRAPEQGGVRVVFTEVPLFEMLPNEAPREFVRRRRLAQRIVSVTPEGGEPRALEAEDANRLGVDRTRSPNGRWLVLAKTVEGVSGLYVRDESSGIEPLPGRRIPQS